MDLFTLLIIVAVVALIFQLVSGPDPGAGRWLTVLVVVLLIVFLGHGYWGHTPVFFGCH